MPKKLLKVLSDYKRGDFSVRLPVDQVGTTGKIYDTLNDVIELNERMAKEFARISNVVGKGGNIEQRASMPRGHRRRGQECVESVNTLVTDLVQPTTEVARVIGAVAKGDLSQSMALEIDGRPLTGEFLRTAKIVNTMVDQLDAVRVGSDARRARGGHRRQARRAGAGARASPARGKTSPTTSTRMASNLTGPGPEHRRRDHRRRQRGPVARRSPWTCAARSWS